uniref:FkbM family methyltransferase n=1 Tax=Acetatifactor sp. TaxID=1872090 RepID=UPI0040562AED
MLLFDKTVEEIHSHYHDRLQDIIDRNKQFQKIVIFGAGEVGHKVYEKLNGLRIVAFADNYLCNRMDERTGLEVIDQKTLMGNYGDALVLVSAFREEMNNAIILQLKQAGFVEKQIVNAGIIGKALELSFLEAHKDEYSKVYALLGDELSKKTYLERLKFSYLGMDLSEIARPVTKNYFNDGVTLSEKEVYIDCGGYIGDTAQKFIETVRGKYKKIVIFEPEPDKAKDIAKNLSGHEYELIQKGVWSSNTILSFRRDVGGGSCIDESGTTQIKLTSLDETVRKYVPTYIKMDIEGAEKEALLGSKEIIREYKPKLAICIYHKPEDLYELPLLMKELNPEYHFIVRHYSNDWYDTVCYAV